MKRLKSMKLHKLQKEKLDPKDMNEIKGGGYKCGCACVGSYNVDTVWNWLYCGNPI